MLEELSRFLFFCNWDEFVGSAGKKKKNPPDLVFWVLSNSFVDDL